MCQAYPRICLGWLGGPLLGWQDCPRTRQATGRRRLGSARRPGHSGGRLGTLFASPCLHRPYPRNPSRLLRAWAGHHPRMPPRPPPPGTFDCWVVEIVWSMRQFFFVRLRVDVCNLNAFFGLLKFDNTVKNRTTRSRPPNHVPRARARPAARAPPPRATPTATRRRPGVGSRALSSPLCPFSGIWQAFFTNLL